MGPHDIGARLCRERRDRGWDATDMARELRRAGHTGSHDDLRRQIRRWERTGRIGERNRLLYARAFGLDVDELFMCDDPGATVEPVKRREFGRAAIGVMLAIPLNGVTPGEPVDVTELQQPDDVVADLYQLDDRYGGAAVAGIAQRRLDSVTRQMARTSLRPSAEARMGSVVGELATCAAWLYFDSGDVRRARALGAEALDAAFRANDQALKTAVLADMSMQAKAAGKFTEAINLAKSAATVARRADPRVRALLSMRIAVAAAQASDTHTYTRARRDAWRHLDRARPEPPTRAKYQFLDDRELSGLDALALLHLGEPAQAAEILTGIVAGHPLARNRAYYSAALAEAQVAAGHPDAAVATVETALPMLTDVTSKRTFSRLGKVRDGLSPYVAARPEFAECHAILGELTSAS